MSVSSFHQGVPSSIAAESGGSPWTRQRLAGGTIMVVVLCAGCNTAPPQSLGKKAVAVDVTTPITSEVTEYQDFTGRLDALKTVDIRARVSGFIMTAPFKEGDMVEEGKLLFLIDPRTYQASFDQAEANLKQAVADRNLQQRNTFRAQKMIEGRSIAQEDY